MKMGHASAAKCSTVVLINAFPTHWGTKKKEGQLFQEGTGGQGKHDVAMS